MPYSMAIYPGDRDAVPEIGDRFVVVSVSESTDQHWGPCIFVRLAPVAAGPETTEQEEEQ